jgi:hypothetical protein
MTDVQRPKVQELEQEEEEELSPERAEEAQGGVRGVTPAEGSRGDRYHFTGPWEL